MYDVRWSDGVLQKRLAWALFCYQPSCVVINCIILLPHIIGESLKQGAANPETGSD